MGPGSSGRKALVQCSWIRSLHEATRERDGPWTNLVGLDIGGGRISPAPDGLALRLYSVSVKFVVASADAGTFGWWIDASMRSLGPRGSVRSPSEVARMWPSPSGIVLVPPDAARCTGTETEANSLALALAPAIQHITRKALPAVRLGRIVEPRLDWIALLDFPPAQYYLIMHNFRRHRAIGLS